MWMLWIVVSLIVVGISPSAFADKKVGSDAVNSEAAVSIPALIPGESGMIALGPKITLALVWIEALKLWIGKYEVTNGQFRRFDASHFSMPWERHVLDDDDQPVVYVTWEQARQYCAWLTRRTSGQRPEGWQFRLPAEKEWEVCALCGDSREFPWGNEWPPPNEYNYRGEEGLWAPARLFPHDQVIRGHKDAFVVAAPVTQSGSNAWGVYGMGGNAWEWCQDEFSKDKKTRVIRGGCWDNYQKDILKISQRSDCMPGQTNKVIGFRVLLAPGNQAEQ